MSEAAVKALAAAPGRRDTPSDGAIPSGTSSVRAVPDGRQLAPRAVSALRAHILVVDDDANVRAYLADLLSTYWSVETAEDAHRALQASRQRVPDLVVSDVMMVGMDGFDLLRVLRADPKTQMVPVILVSARAGEQSTIDALEAGADDYLVKPFSAAELLARVRARLEIAHLRSEAERALREAKESAEAAEQAAELAHRRAERRRRVAESLRDVLAILNSARSLGEVLTYIVSQAAHLLESPAVVMYRLPPEAGAVAVEASYGLSQQALLGPFVRISAERLERMLEERTGVAISDASRLRAKVGFERNEVYTTSDDAHSRFVVPLPSSYNGVAAAPVVVQGDLFGGLALYFRHSRRLSKDELGLVSMFTDQIALAIENARLRDQVREVSASEERARLARELHDAVTQSLFSASLIANSLPRVWEIDPEAGRRGLEELRTMVRGAIAEMRTLLVELRPTGLTSKPLGELLQQLAEAVAARSQLAVTAEIAPDATSIFPPNTQLAAYRIAQEALSNVVKHARARCVQVGLRRDGDAFVLRVRDDGVGFRVQERGEATPPATATDSSAAWDELSAIGSGQLGLAIMRERAKSIGASFTVRSRPGHGTVLTVRWHEHEGS